MSQRGKRPNQLESEDPPPVKRRKGRPPSKGNNATPVRPSTSSAATPTTVGTSGGDGGAGSVSVNVVSGGTSSSNVSHNNSNASNHSQAQDADSSGASTSAWLARPLTDVKMSSIYNRSAPEPPAELFRKDLISAMKLPDSEPLAADEYWMITDQWKQEWERGVQVPVSPDSLPEPLVLGKNEELVSTGRQDFKL